MSRSMTRALREVSSSVRRYGSKLHARNLVGAFVGNPKSRRIAAIVHDNVHGIGTPCGQLIHREFLSERIEPADAVCV